MANESNGRVPFLVGFALIVASFGFYLWRFQNGHLVLPYYLPVLTTVGFVLMVLAFVKKRGILRVLGLGFALLMTVTSYLVVFGLSLPKYEGPVQIGKTIPVFSAKLAGGASFEASNLMDGQDRVLVFYRGLW